MSVTKAADEARRIPFIDIYAFCRTSTAPSGLCRKTGLAGSEVLPSLLNWIL